MTFEIMYITPTIAAEMLQRNIKNRNVSPQVVSSYAADMAAGHWDLTPQPIAFDDRGILMDGQQRLMAVVKSGVSCQFVVCRNAPMTYNIDNGRKRTVLNQLMMRGSSVAESLVRNEIITLARFALRKNRSINVPTAFQLEQFMSSFQPTFEALMRCTKKSTMKGLSIVPVKYALFAALANGTPEMSVACFYSLLISGLGDGSEADKMVIRHRNYLMNLSSMNQKGSTYYDEISKRTQKVLMLFVNNNPLEKIYTPKEDIYDIRMAMGGAK